MPEMTPFAVSAVDTEVMEVGAVERPRTGYSYLDDVAAPAVVAMAHRGGAKHPALIGLENTTAAFRHAADLGFRYLETDIHLTGAGDLVAFHDDRLDRVTDSSGLLATATAEVIRSARIGGEHQIPRLLDLLEEFPQCRFNIDLKADAAAAELANLLARTNAYDRVCVGSFAFRRIREFRRLTQGRAATSAAPVEVAAFLASPHGRLARFATADKVAVLQVPYRHRGIPVVTPSLVRRAHAAGAHVHVWTVDEPDEMAYLIELGVDGLITDRTDVLKDVLTERGIWSDQL